MTITLPVGVTGLLGPNGAGKSTLMKLLATAMPLQDGAIAFGTNLNLERKTQVEIRRRIGYLPQRFELMGWATVRHNVEYAAWAQDVPSDQFDAAVDQALNLMDLDERGSSRARSLSGGMRQRLGLACAMVHQPRVLVLDEPTVGLDPAQRKELRRGIDRLAESAVVLLSTHLVEDLATIADQVIVLHEGKVRFQGSLDALRELGAGAAEEHASVLEAGYHATLEISGVPDDPD